MIFNLTTGERYEITSTVMIRLKDGTLSAPERLSYNATATDKFEVVDGIMRRLFVDAEPPFSNGATHIWLSDNDDDVDIEAFFGVQSRNEDCDPRPQVHFLEPALLPETLGA